MEILSIQYEMDRKYDWFYDMSEKGNWNELNVPFQVLPSSTLV